MLLRAAVLARIPRYHATSDKEEMDVTLTEMDKWAIIKIAEYTGKPIPQVRREYMKLPLPVPEKR